MATITRRLGLRHLQVGPTSFAQHVRRGRIVRGGTGLAFWFRPLVSTISELPIDEQELPLIFRAPTLDFQEVSVQATITYRIVDPARAAGRVDFSIDLADGTWRDAPLEQVGTVLIEQAQQHATAAIARRGVVDILVSGIEEVRSVIDAGLRADARLHEIGIEVVDVRVVAVRPDTELEQALQTPVREQMQQEAAKATFTRRAAAVEQERAIAENELESRIELARQEEDLVRQLGTNEQRRAADEAEEQRIRTESKALDMQVVAGANAERIRLTGAAEAEAQRLQVDAYRDVRDGVLIGLAIRDLAGQLPDVGQLVVTPDLVTSVLSRLAAPPADSELAAIEEG